MHNCACAYAFLINKSRYIVRVNSELYHTKQNKLQIKTVGDVFLQNSHWPTRWNVLLSSQALLRQLALDVAYLFLLGDMLETIYQLENKNKRCTFANDYQNRNKTNREMMKIISIEVNKNFITSRNRSSQMASAISFLICVSTSPRSKNSASKARMST
jgi:hypothetical protein